jgi:tetratricopeptide (TPR) repeat protein
MHEFTCGFDVAENVDDPRVCRACNARGSSSRCPCEFAHYCSAECQKADWGHHKHECEVDMTRELDKLKECHGDKHLLVGEACMRLAKVQKRHENFEEADDNLTIALHVFESDGCLIKTAKVYICMGDLLVLGGEGEEAIERYWKSLKHIRKVPEHPEHTTLSILALNGIAQAYQSQIGTTVVCISDTTSHISDTAVTIGGCTFDYDPTPGTRAIKYAQKALDLNQDYGGLSNIRSRTIIGMVLRDQFDFHGSAEKLEACHEEILSLPCCTDRDILILDIIYNLGGVYSMYAPMDYRENVVQIYNVILLEARWLNGEKHSLVDDVLLRMADSLRRQGGTKQAHRFYKKVLKVCRRNLRDKSDPDVSSLTSKAPLGIAQMHQLDRKYAKAIRRYDEALAVRCIKHNRDLYHFLLSEAVVQRDECLVMQKTQDLFTKDNPFWHV